MRQPFISYAREDYETAVRLHDDLQRAGLRPWLDRKAIRAGEEWRTAIRDGLKSATHVIALISRHSVNKRGFVQNELRQALELLDSIPPGQIYIIPVRLDPSSPNHERLNELHRVDLFDGYETGFERILESLRATSPSAVTPLTQPNLDRAAALIAHELSNQLGLFPVYLNIIKQEAGSNERIARSVDVLDRSVSRTLSFVSAVRAVGREFPATRAKLNIKEWLISLESELRALVGESVSLEIITLGSRMVIAGDRDALTQALFNLVINASQAITPDRGHIVITAELATVSSGIRSVCLSIADTGHGIEPQYVTRIFDAFFTTKSHGTGLGLHVTRSIIAAHNGNIELQSKIGKGTTFFIYLPLAAQSEGS